MSAVFGLEMQPFAAEEYLVSRTAMHPRPADVLIGLHAYNSKE